MDEDQYATAGELLDALTADARAAGKDRFFSYVTTARPTTPSCRRAVRRGRVRSRIEDDRFWLTDVYEDSPAAGAGLSRGAAITHVDSGDRYVPMATVLQEPGPGTGLRPGN